jgi:hypothetical protein
MTFLEAMDKLQQGARVRCNHWVEGTYWYMQGGVIFCRNKNGLESSVSVVSSGTIFSCGWEFYQEDPFVAIAKLPKEARDRVFNTLGPHAQQVLHDALFDTEKT